MVSSSAGGDSCSQQAHTPALPRSELAQEKGLAFRAQGLGLPKGFYVDPSLGLLCEMNYDLLP